MRKAIKLTDPMTKFVNVTVVIWYRIITVSDYFFHNMLVLLTLYISNKSIIFLVFSNRRKITDLYLNVIKTCYIKLIIYNVNIN